MLFAALISSVLVNFALSLAAIVGVVTAAISPALLTLGILMLLYIYKVYKAARVRDTTALKSRNFIGWVIIALFLGIVSGVMLLLTYRSVEK
ncbi:hypothetical protein [Pyrobaculum aerophilum]|uniref:Uncharacterized protein n=1 Tax=Pyrobaculum aerophilum TaxID=13773 RepID=A0A371QWF1_9CREN|nr:hypothetical protein [Pyrobaculum aerophilum]RFA94588.1 hypothetical protein CGL51_09725 [Pyrobaculum aerophilum]RFA99192.1 hypothetical protein CGL52_05010 [Pyrobaculum aerophilum]